MLFRSRVRFETIGAAVTDVNTEDLQSLAANPDVESISADAPVHPSAASSTTFTSSVSSTPSLRETLGETTSNTGAGIGVAVIDSGIAPLGQFGRRIRAFYDFTSGRPVATPPTDPYGHGTHVAGLIAANDRNYMGVAPLASLIGLRVLDDTGAGRTSAVISAIDFAVANQIGRAHV